MAGGFLTRRARQAKRSGAAGRRAWRRGVSLRIRIAAGRPARANRRFRRPCLAERARRDLADAAQRPGQRSELERHDEHLLVRRQRELLDRVHVFVGDEIIDRGGVAASRRLADQPRRGRLRLGGALARFRRAKGGLAPPFRFEDEAALRPSAR